MEKLSSHFIGQGTRRPFCSYSTRIRQANIRSNLTTVFEITTTYV
jgi:hypothetical protein